MPGSYPGRCGFKSRRAHMEDVEKGRSVWLAGYFSWSTCIPNEEIEAASEGFLAGVSWQKRQVRALIESWAAKQGHDRCWYYPEIFLELAKAVGLEIGLDPKLPPRAEFEEGCRKYQCEQYGCVV